MASEITYPDWTSNHKIIEYINGLSNSFDFDEVVPTGLVVHLRSKKKLVIIGSDNAYTNRILCNFPLPRYGNILWINDHNFVKMMCELDTIVDSADCILYIDDCKTKHLVIYASHPKAIVGKIAKLSNIGDVVQYRFGNKNPDRKILVVKVQPAVGLLNNYNSLCSHMNNLSAFDAFVDMQNYPNVSIEPAHLGIYNPWEFFFNQLSNLSMDEIYESSCVYVWNLRWGLLKEAAYSLISPTMQEYVERKYRELFEGRRVLGVSLRGTAYWFAKWHPIPFDEHEAIQVAEKYMAHYGLDYIFLATEDLVNYNAFKKYFGDRLLSISRKRFDRSIIALDNKKSPMGFDSFYNSFEYLLEVLLMSKVYGVIASDCNSTKAIKFFGKINHVFFDMCLSKNYRGACGNTPILIESHNKNHVPVINVQKCLDGIFVHTDQDNLIQIIGESPVDLVLPILSHECIHLRPFEEYVFSFLQSAELQIEYVVTIHSGDCDINLENGHVFHVPFGQHEISISLRLPKGKYSGHVAFQIEKGPLSTPYNGPVVSTTEFAVKDSEGIYYLPQSTRLINLSRGDFLAGSVRRTLHTDELKRLNNIVLYPGGYVTYHYGQDTFDDIFEIMNADATGSIDDCLEMPYFDTILYGSARSHLQTLLQDYMKSSCNAARKLIFELCNSNSNNPFFYKYLSLMYRDGVGIEPNISEALRWMKKAASCDVKLKKDLFNMLLESKDPTSKTEVIRLCEESSDMSWACGHLGRVYRDGANVEKDLDKSICWYRKAYSMNKRHWVREFCNVLHARGSNQDMLEILSLSDSIRQSKSAVLCEYISNIYLEGVVVNKNLNLAREWMKLSVELDSRYQSKLDYLVELDSH